MMNSANAAIRETTDSLRTVFRNPGLRRINLALAGSLIGDWAYATALTVWAYQVGGVTAVGIWGVVRLALLALITPFASTLADRFPRKRVMVVADLLRGVLVFIAAGLVLWDGPVAAVFIIGTLATVCSAPFRPAQMALLPSLVDEPEELTAANGAASTLESLAFFVGPAIGGLLLTVADIPLVFALNALTFLWSAALVVGLRPHAPVTRAEATEDAPDDSADSFLTESVAGFRTIWASPDLRLVTGIYCAQTVVAGASLVFGVALAVDIIGSGPQGVGYLDAVLGVGALFGGLLAIARGSKHRLATDFGIGVLFWALPLLMISVWPQAAPAFVAMFIIGAANPVVDVNASTILQRLSPDAVLGRVFGALETGLISTMALGALVMPLLINTVGLRWSLATLAIGITLVVLPGFARLRRLNDSLRPPEGLELLENVALFAPLDRPTLEALARRLTTLECTSGDIVVAEGQAGDNFYVIESGSVRVTRQGQAVRTETAGEFFGEVALIRDVPRTATVTAIENTVLLVLGRDDFLAALNGSNEARRAAEEIVSRRLPPV